MSSSVAIVTLGCKTNQFESAAMSEQLQQAGYQQVAFDAGADLVIVNTCTVTAATDAQSRKLIRRARRLNSKARIVVTGCYAQIDPQSLNQLAGVSLVIGNNEKGQLLKYLDENKNLGEIQVSDIRSRNVIEPLSLTGFEQRSRAFVQIQNGCDAFCSYCIIPYARGRSRSVAVPEVVSQVEKLSANGYPEIVLTGIHIGQYGQDFDSPTDLLFLLQKIEQSQFSGRLRLGSIEPTELSEGLYRYILGSDWICPHFHIPLQAGDDDILRRMNRHYSTAFFAGLLQRLQQINPEAAIGLDVITGFPGETDAQFKTTCQLLRQLPFSHLHVFPFSNRAGTPAAKMPDQVTGAVIKERAQALRQIGTEKNQKFAEKFIGSKQDIIIEGGCADDLRKGLSRHYLPVWIPASSAEPGESLQVEITGVYQDGLIGHR
ncbi:tRNA (N(6)-L-threonylcarbamoyladenosine(37)-C(2))-methylthiotransferase MtaB [uncultured Desulfuromusa sp.]|uniref:tRNA (N(6)-L-threonylcarbamoyladenosine(37)-C(2))- methylthiotransferase MtaB n=1 Tax=uncultured Desulfuromusa sp. TaxID=219183 RepID=UPI002AA9359C|nr:tRNA (N(6)-L-threonylcarbamoyladenosine(37)-C(2))-methylthiotransferase MtaB [uncultured Desulfuromusa sp.]